MDCARQTLDRTCRIECGAVSPKAEQTGAMHTLTVTLDDARPRQSASRSRPLAAYASRYFLFENWTWDEPDTAARVKAAWPAWRRAVRPVGAAAWWIGVVIGWATGNNSWANVGLPVRVITVALGVVLVTCIVFGVVDGARTRRNRRRLGVAVVRSPC